MTELLTAAQMRAIEKAAIDSGEVTGLELMERAGRGVVEAIFEEWPELGDSADGGAAPEPPGYLGKEEGGRRAVVLCGPGNNGGDGFVVARLLKERGWEVEVFLYGDALRLPEDARVNYERWGGVGRTRKVESADIDCSDVTLVVDALFGTGLSRALASEISAIGEAIFNSRGATFFVAIDILSGICSDSGRPICGRTIFPYAELTASFHTLKCGHLIGAGAFYSGEVKVVDIDLEQGQRQHASRSVRLTEAPIVRLRKSRMKQKYHHGHALILSGGVGKGGAARLAARGALRIGAGLVTVGCPPGALLENAGALEAIMVRSVKGVEGLVEALRDERINAVCLGPGLGLSDDTHALVGVALKSARSVVLDADALSVFREEPGALFAMAHRSVVLTPHGGEFARLFPDIAAKLDAPATKGPAYSKVDATREAAARAGCVVLFKGADTVIADAGGRCSINSAHYERCAPWLATAGSGDVLAGFITGLLARGFEPMQAAETGAWLHVECAIAFGPGLIAEDLPEMLPKVFARLGV